MRNFMKYLLYMFGVQFMFLLGNNQVAATTCLSPSGKLNRGACIASCQAQNCATGNCNGDTCVCSGCSNGTPW